MEAFLPEGVAVPADPVLAEPDQAMMTHLLIISMVMWLGLGYCAWRLLRSTSSVSVLMLFMAVLYKYFS